VFAKDSLSGEVDASIQVGVKEKQKAVPKGSNAGELLRGKWGAAVDRA